MELNFWRNKEGQLHRLDGPAVKLSDGDKYYFINDIKYDSLEEGLMDQALE